MAPAPAVPFVGPPPPQTVRRVPRVLVLYDQPGWAFHRIAERLRDAIAARYDVRLAHLGDRGHGFDYDAVVALWWGAADRVIYRVPQTCHVYLCVFDHFTRMGERGHAQFRRLLERASAVTASNRILQAEIRDTYRVAPLLMTDGVDVERFAFVPHRLPHDAVPLRVAWVGNSALGGGIKGLELLRAAVAQLPGTQLVLADAAQAAVPYAHMPQWYADRVDILACCSSSEGTPNPVLEAAAVGRAIVSTRVGIVPELLDASGGGIWIRERTVGGVRAALERACELRHALPAMGEANRREVEARWRWDDRFRELLERMGRDMVRGPALHTDLSACAGDGTLETGRREGEVRVLVVYDSPGWAFHRIAEHVRRCAPDGVAVQTVAYPELERRPAETGPGRPCAALLLWWDCYERVRPHLPPDCRVLVAVYDEHYTLGHPAGWAGGAAAADGVVLANRGMRRRILPWLPSRPRSVAVAPDGVDLEAFAPQPWGPSEGPLRVAWVGNSDPARHGHLKGWRIAVEACHGLPVRLLTADPHQGTGRPWVQMPALYRDCEVLLCTSAAEGTPNPVLEAAASGRPWLSTDVGVVPELMDCAAPGGIVVPREVPVVREMLRYLAVHRDLLRRMGAAARATVEAGWSWDVRALAHWAALRDVLPCD